MKVTPIADPIPGERILAVFPTPAVVIPDWRRRLNLFTGRTLSDVALRTEQGERTGRLATRGQMVSPGVVQGLEAALEMPADDVSPIVLHVGAGSGLTALGEDVGLATPRAFPLSLLGAPPAIGIAILVLQPAAFIESEALDPADPCAQDPGADAFSDDVWVDASQLVLVPWPDDPTAFPLPTAGPQLRNRLAHAIFEKETQLGLDDVLPWEEKGVPLGVLAFGGDGKPLFLDRFSVVRAGGRAKRHTSLLAAAGLVANQRGTRFGWQARIQQLAEQTIDQGQRNLAPAARLAELAFLPPVGVLPKDSMIFGGGTVTNQFFPPGAVLVAAPVPLEQLDEAIDRSTSLAPIDLGDVAAAAEPLIVLVPVPQAVYEPTLLVHEEPDPLFASTIASLETERGQWLARRHFNRDRGDAINRSISGPATASLFPTVDPDAVVGETESADPADTADEDARGTTVAGSTITVSAIAALVADFTARGLFTAADLTLPNGLQGLIDLIESKHLDKANDVIDITFLRTQTDIYRLRQQMLDESSATRLATSPALASIAKGTSAVAVRDDLNRFFQSIKDQKVSAASGSNNPVVSTASTSFVPLVNMATLSLPTFSVFGLNTTFSDAASAASVVKAVGGAAQLSVAGLQAARPLVPTTQIVNLESSASSILPIQSLVQKGHIIGASPIIGQAFQIRSVSVAERIEQSRAQEGRNYALANRVEALNNIDAIGIVVGDLPVPGVLVRDAQNNPQYDTKTKLPQRAQLTFDQVRQLDLGAKGKGIATLLDDSASTDADEAALFSDTVNILESTVITLRAVEGRIAAYQRAADAAHDTLSALQDAINGFTDRLTAIAGQLVRVRHDLGTANALLADEVARVANVNARRTAVIRDRVQFLAFQRPRAAEALVPGVPARAIDPGLTVSPLPACLAHHGEAPPELHEMVAVLREAPLRWFLHVPKVLDQLDRLELLHGTIQTAKARATLLAQPVARAAPLTFLVPKAVSVFGDAIARATQVQRTIVNDARATAAGINLAALANLSWKESREQAVQVLTIGDLVEGGHGHSEIGRQASEELENITDVANCLYTRVGSVTPALRLRWAQLLSQYDTGVSLRNLSALPGWGDVPALERQEMQILVDWLYSRIDASVPEASTVIHDLARVCILLASHAPVNQIIAGDLAAEQNVVRGGTISVRADPGRVRLGMQVVLFSNNQSVARGVVEDLRGGNAIARILDTQADSVRVAAGARAHFLEAGEVGAPRFRIG